MLLNSENKIHNNCVNLVWEEEISLILFLLFCLLLTSNGLSITVLPAFIMQVCTYGSVKCSLHVSRPFNFLWHACEHGYKVSFFPCHLTGLDFLLTDPDSWVTRSVSWVQTRTKSVGLIFRSNFIDFGWALSSWFRYSLRTRELCVYY